MNIEDYREYCLSLGDDVEEKLPFTAFRYASGVLVFYVHGHMFSFFDCDHFSVVTLKYKNNKPHRANQNGSTTTFDNLSCLPDSIEELRARYDCIVKPSNLSPKYWIGINPNTAPDDLLRDLTRNSYEIVKAMHKRQE